MASTHESYSRNESVSMGSERSFGIVMAVAFGLIALLNWWHDGHIWTWLAGAAGLFLIAALVRPRVLRPLNRLWFKFGLMLHAVVNPLVMGLIFYGAVWPTALVMRLRGKEFLQLRRDPGSDSYWIARRPPGPAPESMRDQF